MTFDQDSLTAHFGRIWPVHNDAFCELLVTLRRQFGGDLDRMLVLAVIGSRTLSQGRIDRMSYDQFMDSRRADEPAPINLQSIADYSGIPRETVRRKLHDLERAGWITRRDKGYLVATAKAAVDLEPATRATMRYLLAVVGAWREAISEQKSGS
ncbi:helix-turn-helix domain-containing protein [Thiocapsa bogorovii]|uniref:helix-turn-helix domain-containing protein n=1 Tax=Thiocapsa bogorovii TaxID=521689 RepID=UPI001E5C0CD3|nr:helix-turn-helix domain-containing protein [Thiocapsa bogorovii]UHD17233.1 helix-turn-helix domain-containing protein [Thiocapsa bogorovii]